MCEAPHTQSLYSLAACPARNSPRGGFFDKHVCACLIIMSMLFYDNWYLVQYYMSYEKHVAKIEIKNLISDLEFGMSDKDKDLFSALSLGDQTKLKGLVDRLIADLEEDELLMLDGVITTSHEEQEAKLDDSCCLVRADKIEFKDVTFYVAYDTGH